jgi:5'-3' exonuclease
VQPPVPKFSFEREAIKKYFKMKDLVQFIGSVHATFKKGEQEEIEAKKKEFYRRYFAMQDMERLDDVCLEYLKGIDFVINYYFKGCPSWTWAFKYNMSPFLSDLCQCLERHVASINHRFEMDEPLLPFHQMAYLLPKDSLDLLPAPLAHELRTNPTVSQILPRGTRHVRALRRHQGIPVDCSP